MNGIPLATVALVVSMVLTPNAGMAADPTTNSRPLDQEIWQKSQKLRPQASFDTTPVIVRVEGISYRVPRNYLTDLGSIPVITIKLPGFTPLTEETRSCFGSILDGQKAGCASLEFNLEGSRLSPREQFVNSLKNMHSTEKEGPFGYRLYEIGPANFRTEEYVKEEGEEFIFVYCFIQGQDRQTAVCTDTFSLEDGNSMHFFFFLNQLQQIPEIEMALRRLMESFRVKGVAQ